MNSTPRTGFLIIYIWKEVKVTGGDEIPKKIYVEGGKKAGEWGPGEVLY